MGWITIVDLKTGESKTLGEKYEKDNEEYLSNSIGEGVFEDQFNERKENE